MWFNSEIFNSAKFSSRQDGERKGELRREYLCTLTPKHLFETKIYSFVSLHFATFRIQLHINHKQIESFAKFLHLANEKKNKQNREHHEREKFFLSELCLSLNSCVQCAWFCLALLYCCTVAVLLLLLFFVVFIPVLSGVSIFKHTQLFVFSIFF